MVRRTVLLVLSGLALMLPLAPANAIIRGEPDGAEHPFVGELLFFLPDEVDDRFDDPGS